MEKKLDGLPPLKRFTLMQMQQQETPPPTPPPCPSLPAKKRKSSLSPPPTTYCLPAKKRIWAFQPIDLNVEYNPLFDSQEITKETDDDDGILCAVCHSTDGDPLDPIVFCDGCDLMVHATCYGYPLTKGIPDGDWFCKLCLVSKSSKQNDLFSCCLCPLAGGALKPTNDGKWAHIVCALFVPEVFFTDPDGREGIDCTKVPLRRWEHYCYVCDSVNGCAIDCSEPKCPLGFHVTCGLKQDLCIEYRQEKSKAIVAGFCKTHSDLWKKQQETGKYKIVAREELDKN